MPKTKLSRQRPSKVSNASEEVQCRWETREFIVLEEDPETGDYRVKLEPVPIIRIPRSTMEIIAEGAKLPLTDAAHKRIEQLVARRILYVCGFTVLGADNHSMFIPSRARPEAIKVAKLAGSLLKAIESFDQKSSGSATKRLNHMIEGACGASPRAGLLAIQEIYRRFVPKAADAKKLGKAIFMAEVRDQVLAGLVPDWGSLNYDERNRILKQFLAKLDDLVLRPLSRRGRIPSPPGGGPALSGAGSNIIVALVSNTSDSSDSLRHTLNDALVPYDKQRAEAAAHWERVFARQKARAAPSVDHPFGRKK